MISLKEQTLITNTYRKATAANTLLKADSHHPKWQKNGIPVGQFLRLKRNCTENHKYREEEKDLYKRFRERGYSHRQLRRAKQKVAKIERKELLHKQDNENNKRQVGDQVRFITQFGVQWEEVRASLQKNWGILQNNTIINAWIGKSPMMTARRSPNLGDILIKSEFIHSQNENWLTGHPRTKGMFSCGKCHICPYVDRTDTFRDSSRQNTGSVI